MSQCTGFSWEALILISPKLTFKLSVHTHPLRVKGHTYTIYLTDGGERDLVAGEAEGLSILRSILLSPETRITSQTAEVVHMPVLVLCTSVLTTQDQLVVWGGCEGCVRCGNVGGREGCEGCVRCGDVWGREGCVEMVWRRCRNDVRVWGRSWNGEGVYIYTPRAINYQSLTLHTSNTVTRTSSQAAQMHHHRQHTHTHLITSNSNTHTPHHK